MSAALTCFGAGLDRLARSVGGWPDASVVHTMEVLNGGGAGLVDPQVLLEGHIPTGEKNGHATFKGCPRAASFRAVVRLSEYRTAIAETRAASGTLTEGGDVEQAPGDSLSGPTAKPGRPMTVIAQLARDSAE